MKFTSNILRLAIGLLNPRTSCPWLKGLNKLPRQCSWWFGIGMPVLWNLYFINWCNYDVILTSLSMGLWLWGARDTRRWHHYMFYTTSSMRARSSSFFESHTAVYANEPSILKSDAPLNHGPANRSDWEHGNDRRKEHGSRISISDESLSPTTSKA